MILHIEGGRWYIDVRTTAISSDQVSYDMACHLPRRLAAGPVVVVADNTKVFLSVIRKRWMKLLHEVECQRSSTLDRFRRQALQHEVDQMSACSFASKPPAEQPGANVYCLLAGQLAQPFPAFMTIYLTTRLTHAQVGVVAESLAPGGLAVLYGPWLPQYEPLLRAAYARTEIGR
jgi:hypothetical protein